MGSRTALTKFMYDTLQRGVHANPIYNLRGTQGRGEAGTWGT
jgi:hypothetical protein